MCNDINCSHDLDDSLDGLFDGPVSKLDLAAGVALARAQQMKMTHEEPCSKCRGTGRFVGYTGRVLGNCFTCKGTGKLTFRTSVAQREKGREAAQRRKDRAAQDTAEQARGWRMANPNEDAWLASASARGFEFAVSLNAALDKYGHLTEKQEAAVRSATAKWIEAAKVRAATQQQGAAVDMAKIEQAFASALDKGVKRPKITLTGIKISLAPATGRNAGSLYVVAVENDQYLGRITAGRFFKVRECSAEQEAEVLRVAADPLGAAVAHGQRTGNCCVCNRELTNHASIDAGVGPICASRFGW